MFLILLPSNRGLLLHRLDVSCYAYLVLVDTMILSVSEYTCLSVVRSRGSIRSLSRSSPLCASGYQFRNLDQARTAHSLWACSVNNKLPPSPGFRRLVWGRTDGSRSVSAPIVVGWTIVARCCPTGSGPAVVIPTPSPQRLSL
jgi:hypothetical protein